MRHSRSPQFARAEAAHRQAYAVHDKLAEVGDDDSPEAIRASQAEYEALDALMLTPCRHPLDVASKLDLIFKRGIYDFSGFDRLRDSLQRDLAEIARPGASAEMKAAWAHWATCWLAFETSQPVEDDGEAICDSHCDATRALLAVPCSTPGDFIVKSYIELLMHCEHSAHAKSDGRGFLFEFKRSWREAGENCLENDAREAAIGDIDNCDLGRCMIALGALDFEPAPWVAAAQRAGMDVTLMIDADGTRGLYLGESVNDDRRPVDRERARRVRALVSFDDTRVEAIKDEIEAFFPNLVARVARQQAEQVAA